MLQLGINTFILEGRFKVSHGVILGCKHGFDIFDDNNPALIIILIDTDGECKLQRISQWIIKVINLRIIFILCITSFTMAVLCIMH